MNYFQLPQPFKVYLVDPGILGILDLKDDPASTGHNQAQLALDANAREVGG